MISVTLRIAAAAIGAAGLSLGTAAAAENPMVGGAAMYSTRNIVQNAWSTETASAPTRSFTTSH